LWGEVTPQGLPSVFAATRYSSARIRSHDDGNGIRALPSRKALHEFRIACVVSRTMEI
jgi:hypothetical protein